MKKIILFICISAFFSLSLSGQISKESREKIKAYKVAFLTEQLNLTSNEAEKFWPIYNTYDNEQSSLRNKSRSEMKKSLKDNGQINAISEQEAERLILLKLENDRKIYQSQKDFISKIKKVLSFKKIIQLQVAEMEFGRKLMRRYKDKKKSKKE